MAHCQGASTSLRIVSQLSSFSFTRITAVPSRLWPLVDEPIANRSFDTLDELEEVVFQRCRALLRQPDLIRGFTSFHWWIQIGA